jgi:hypothetical protein
MDGTARVYDTARSEHVRQVKLSSSSITKVLAMEARQIFTGFCRLMGVSERVNEWVLRSVVVSRW